jgi:hypothetical protein
VGPRIAHKVAINKGVTMGYRANTVIQHRAYGGTTFSDWVEFTSNFIPSVRAVGVDVIASDYEDFFSVNKVELQAYVKSLPNNEVASAYPSYTNQELKDKLQIAIDESPGRYVSWEWF